MKKAILFFLLLSGCGTEMTYQNPDVGNPYNETKMVTITVVVGKYDSAVDCQNNGGMWVRGDTHQYINALVGCVENIPVKPVSGKCEVWTKDGLIQDSCKP